MPIHSLELTNVGPFRRRPDGAGSDGIKLEFDANVNLFIGPNNVGKSTILHALYLLTRHRIDEHLGGDVSSIARLAGPSWDRAYEPHVESLQFAITPLGYAQPICGSFAELFAPLVVQSNGQPSWNEIIDAYGFIGYRHTVSGIDAGIRAGDTDDQIQDQLDLSLLSSAHNIAQMLEGSDEFDRQVVPVIFGAITAITQEFHLAIDGEVMYADTEWLRGKSLTDVFLDSKDPNTPAHISDLGNYKVETTDGAHPFADLSHGTLSTLAWVSQFVMGMARHYRGVPDWKERRGIFIIDEIDAHLHPSWQRRIIPTLQRHFPNVQIFASTHSPMMVAGLKKGQVHLLKRDETGQVDWSRNEQDIIGWTADEIYRTFMGIDDPTDELTVQRANRLRELRDKEARTEAEEDEMNALRRQVNQDLLAKGRINAQRERYAGLMERFLRARMSELSQDGA